jgi:CHRD domain
MRLRTLAVLFAAGLVAVGVAVAGINGNWSDHANGAQEVPPRDTQGQAQAIFHLSPDGTALDYKLIASNIDNVFMAHIHMEAPDRSAPGVSTASSRRARSRRQTSSARSRVIRCPTSSRR